ncbi:MAG TPA: response regulator transcription factor [Streptomyces sp.]|nr:response regulator transcription factor [Streptomyces sp.]
MPWHRRHPGNRRCRGRRSHGGGSESPAGLLKYWQRAQLARRGVRLFLGGQPDLQVVAEAGDGAEAIAKARPHGVDLAVLDIALPRTTGLRAARELIALKPGLRVLMPTMHDNEQYFFHALKAGAGGYVLKSVADRDLVAACRAAMRDEPFRYQGAVTALVRDYLDRVRHGEEPPDQVVTPREEEVLKLVAEGHSSKEMGTQAPGGEPGACVGFSRRSRSG